MSNHIEYKVTEDDVKTLPLIVEKNKVLPQHIEKEIGNYYFKQARQRLTRKKWKKRNIYELSSDS